MMSSPVGTRLLFALDYAALDRLEGFELLL
jgi:hypothetical protein